MRLIDADKLRTELFDAGWLTDNDEHMVEEIVERQPTVDAEPVITGETSDGYHTFNELYHHRAVLFSVIVKAFEDKAWKSRKHHDGTMYDGMFIVGVETPYGQATYHYDMEPYWEMFCCKEIERAPEWDGHTPAQAIERIGKLEPVRHGRWEIVIVSTSNPYESEIEEKCSLCGRFVQRYAVRRSIYLARHPLDAASGAAEGGMTTKLNDLLNFVHEKQQVWLCYEGYIVEAYGEAMSAMLSEDIYKGNVTAVEAEGDKLKIWAKEE